ncbi:MAG: universal stress protein [Halobacteriota archaeon]|uniref:universal stress protein n=1 Tax=Natronomonas sp. TaxID=2184060 RepID=UPI0039769112
MTRNVLVPVDDSKRSLKALEFAIENVPDASVTALHVIDPRSFSAKGIESGITTDVAQLRETRERAAETLIEKIRGRGEELGSKIDTAIETGKPAREIVSYAEEHDVDQIVIGSHGRTGASRVLLGSVAETVVRRSPVPVTVVR